MPCKEGPDALDLEWRKLSRGEQVAAYVLAAWLADDPLDRRFFIGYAGAYARGVYGRKEEDDGTRMS